MVHRGGCVMEFLDEIPKHKKRSKKRKRPYLILFRSRLFSDDARFDEFRVWKRYEDAGVRDSVFDQLQHKFGGGISQTIWSS